MTSHLRENGWRSNAAAHPACSICGTLNAHGAEFCRCCGVSITRASEPVAPLERGGFCEACQCLHATPARFCDQCGSRLPGYVRPPNSSDRNRQAPARTESDSAAETMPVARKAKAGQTAVLSAAPEDRRAPKMHYLLVPALCAATVAGMYLNGYRLTRAAAGQPAPLQATVSLPAALPYPPAVLLPALPENAVEEHASIDAALRDAQPGVHTGNGARADSPAPATAKPQVRLVASQRIIVGNAYEEPVSAIRKLPAMPIHDFKSVVQLDPAGK